MCTKELYKEYKFSCEQANLIYPEIYSAAMQGITGTALIEMLIKENAYGSVLDEFLAWVIDCKNKRKLMTDTCYQSKADIGHKLPITRADTLIKAIRDYTDHALRKLETIDFVPCLPFRDMMKTWQQVKNSIKVDSDGELIVGKFSTFADIIIRNDEPIQWPLQLLKRMMEIVCFIKVSEGITWKDIARSWSDETTKPYVRIYAKVTEDNVATLTDAIPHTLLKQMFTEQDLVWANLMFLSQIRYWSLTT